MTICGEGSFINKGGHIFRLKAELKFGKGTGKTIVAIGLNPGSCKLNDASCWDNVLYTDNQIVTGEIKLDSTMRHIQKIILEAAPDFQGKVVIHNLINYRNGNLKEALACYRQLKNKGEHETELETDFETVLKEHPTSFVWLGWSLTQSSMLKKRKQQVLDTIHRLQKHVVAKFHNDNPSSPHVWHFRPILETHADAYRTYIVPLLRQSLL